MTQKNYKYFTSEDFIHEESFRDFVYKRNSLSVLAWEQWILENPDKHDDIREAIEYLESIQPTSNTPSNLKYKELSKLISQISLQEKRLSKRKSRYVYPIAAAISGILFFAALLYLINYPYKNTITKCTAFGKIERVTLPDSSEVTLNANSKISYRRIWKDNDVREVWLEGEAFFHVKKSGEGRKKFFVHSRGINVEVVGTSFNVSQRKGETVVVLNTGKIKLNIHQLPQLESLLMAPGEMVKYSESENRLERELVKPERFSSWKEGYLIFENTSMREIISVFENNYGRKIIVKDSNILKRKLTGDFPSDNPEFILNSIKKTFDLNITQHENIIIIQNNTQF